MMGRHASVVGEVAYGRHARREGAVTVRELLEEAMEEGRPLRLVWPGHEPDELVGEGEVPAQVFSPGE
jgi:hypothetical protein